MVPWIQKVKSGWHGLSRVTQIILLCLVVLLVGLRLALPSLVERFVNRKLNEMPNYRGKIGEVDIHLYRGAYSIHHIDISKIEGQVPIPFFTARVVDFSVQWMELFHGSIVAELEVDGAKLDFVKGETPAESQTKVDKNWTDVVKDLAPFDLNRFVIRHSEVWFRDVTTQPKVDLFITNLFVLGTNFNNAREVSTNLPAGLWVTGRSLGGGELKIEAHINPFAAKPTFDYNAELRNADLTALNEMLRAYARIDLTRGRLSIFSEMAAKDGAFAGYVTPLLEDLKFLDLKQDKNPVKIVWESFVAAVVHLFKNHPTDRAGTKIPISGSFDNPSISIWGAFVNVFRNFVSAFPAHVEGSISEEDLRKMQKELPPKKK